MATEPTTAETNRPIKTAERDAQCAVDDLKQARRCEGEERAACIAAAKQRLRAAIDALDKITKSQG